MNNNIEKVLEGLNPGQLAAAKHINGPALVLAGPGAGKTKTLVTRTQYMILNGIDPSKILLTTFTNKAANEIKERIINVVGESGKQITVGTYHSICNKILRKYAEYIGYAKNFTILDETESDKIIKKVAEMYNADKDLVKLFISSNKTKYLTPQQAYNSAESDSDKTLANCYQKYQDELERQMAMDFSDLLFKTAKLMETNADIKKELNNRWQYISCDEFQDTDPLNMKFISLLGEHENLYLIGDSEQEIYKFKGAEIEIFQGLQTVYPNIKLYNLDINYRSSDTIIKLGRGLINHNKIVMSPEMKCGRNIQGMKAVFTTVKTQNDEAKKVVSYIKTMHKKGIPLKEIAVLYRANYLSRNIEKILMENKIKYKIFGGIPFFNREEVQDLLSYARLTINPRDYQAFKRSIAIPKRGIGEKTLDKIDDFCRDNDLPIRNALTNKNLPVKGKAKTSIEEYNKLLTQLDKNKADMSPDKFIQSILALSGYYEYLRSKYKGDQLEDKMQNITELISVAKEYDNIEDLIIQASLYKEELEDEEDDYVNLLTMHKSKGLEFKVVILIDMNEGTLPFFKATSVQDIEEERRLAYVAVTRAKDFLFMIYPQTQIVAGQPKYSKVSRFIKEMNQDLLIKN